MLKLKDLNAGQLFIFAADVELCKLKVPLYRIVNDLQFLQYGVGCPIEPMNIETMANHEVRIIDF